MRISKIFRISIIRIKLTPPYCLVKKDKEDKKLKDRNLSLVDSSKNTEKEKLPPSIKPKNIEQVTFDNNTKKLKIINNFQR